MLGASAASAVSHARSLEVQNLRPEWASNLTSTSSSSSSP